MGGACSEAPPILITTTGGDDNDARTPGDSSDGDTTEHGPPELDAGVAAASLPMPETGAACADTVMMLHAIAASADNARRFIADPSMKPTLVQSGSSPAV